MIQELCWEKVKGKCNRRGSRGGRGTEMEMGTDRKERHERDMSESCTTGNAKGDDRERWKLGTSGTRKKKNIGGINAAEM